MIRVFEEEKKEILERVVALTDVQRYNNFSKDIDLLIKKYVGTFLDMPGLIRELSWLNINNLTSTNSLETSDIGVNSAEYLCNKDSDMIYVVGHSLGPLANLKRLEKRSGQIIFDGLLDFENSELVKFKDESAISLNDLRHGVSSNKPYAVKTLIPQGYKLIPRTTPIKDVLRMHKSPRLIIFESGSLTREQFLLDDRVLMIAGSLEGREKIAKMLPFEQEKSLGSYHHIMDKMQPGHGRQLIFSTYFGFQVPTESLYNEARFMVSGSRKKLLGPTAKEIMTTLSENDLLAKAVYSQAEDVIGELCEKYR